MSTTIALNRRQFMVLTAMAGGGLAIDLASPVAVNGQVVAPVGTPVIPHGPNPVNVRPWLPPVEGGVEVSPWFVISADNYVTMRVSQTEEGQGVMTSNPMMFCEELECDWSKVRAMYVDVNRQVNTSVYDTRSGGGIGTGASGSVRDGRIVYQMAGAQVREMLRLAAAQQWGVPVDEVIARNSMLTHRGTNRTLTYGDVAARAATITLDRQPRLKRPDQYRTMIGKRVRMFDVDIKTYGEAIYSMDIRLPDMLYAAVKICPVLGGKLKSFDFEAVRNRPGVHSAVPLAGNDLPQQAVAVVADSWWRAKTAVDTMPVEWDEGPNASVTSKQMFTALHAELDKPGGFAFDEGDVKAALPAGARVIEAVYEMPNQSHAPMEPMACTVRVTADRVDVWSGSPGPEGLIDTAARLTGMPTEKVFAYNAFVGGSFGGGARPRQTVNHAVQIAKTLNGRPVKVVWSRDQDLANDNYRQKAVARCRGAVAANGAPLMAHYRVASDPDRATAAPVPVGRHRVMMDRQSGWGWAALPYGIPNQRAEISVLKSAVPNASWRAPGHVNAAFVIESFIDEMAHAAGQDPYKFRRALIQANPGNDPGFRHKDSWIRALDIAAEKSGWGTPLPRGSGRGIAIDDRRKHTAPEAQANGGDHSLVSIAAVVAEVTVSREGVLRVTHVTVAHDIGDGLINPEAVDRQIHGQFAWAMSAGIHQEITLEKGRVAQTNLHTYPMIRLDEFPTRIDVHYFPKHELIAGAGEEAIPSIMPAICNAIFAATGKRLRTMPLKYHDLRWS